MKVLFLTLRADLGGGPEHLYQLLKHCPTNIEAYVACPAEAPYFDRFKQFCNDDHLFELPHRKFQILAFIRLMLFIKAQGIDVLHSHGKGAGIYARLAALVSGVRCVHTFHGVHIDRYGAFKKFLYLKIEQVFAWVTWKGIAVSKGERAQVKALSLLPDHKITCVENGVFVPAQPAPNTNLPESDQHLEILAVCRMDYQKNPTLLLDIVAKLVGRCSFRLRVIGDGPMMAEVQQRRQQLGLTQYVEFLGAVQNPREMMRSAHVFLSTSRWEGMPLAALEAMSEGLCPVLSDVVGNQDIIENGHSGFLFRNIEEASEILRMVAQEAIATPLGLAAHRRVRAHFDVERMASKTYAVLSEAYTAPR